MLFVFYSSMVGSSVSQSLVSSISLLVTSTYSISAYADVEVTSNEIELTSDWDTKDPTILE